MINLTLVQIQFWLQQQGIEVELQNCSSCQADQLIIKRIHTDSRTLESGDLFVAINGEKFDAHEFIEQARQSGAVVALVEKKVEVTDLPLLQVASTRKALAAIAKAWRLQFELPIIAVTGSNGKTTVTQMLAVVLERAFAGNSLATKGNFNNDIGVPLTLLRLRNEDRAAVIELGMNHIGEIQGLADMTAPTVALVNNAQREHQEFMQSVEAVAYENASVFKSLPTDGIAVYPADDQYLAIWKKSTATKKTLTFAEFPAQADVVGKADWQQDCWLVNVNTPDGVFDYRLNLVGRHNVRNSLAALACAIGAGINAELTCQALEQFQPVKGRSQLFARSYQNRLLQVVDDSYNANPDSVLAAIKVLTQLPAPRLLILGDMGEVGKQSQQFHQEVGEYANSCAIDAVWTLGEDSQVVAKVANGKHFESMVQLKQYLIEQLSLYQTILVKGSRFMQMEQIVETLLQHSQQWQVNQGDNNVD